MQGRATARDSLEFQGGLGLVFGDKCRRQKHNELQTQREPTSMPVLPLINVTGNSWEEAGYSRAN